MSDLPDDKQSFVAKTQLEIEELLKAIPVEHRGLLFSRLLSNFHPQENTRRLEVGFALEWARINNPDTSGQTLSKLLYPQEDDNSTHLVPRTEREWTIVEFAIATLVQWLPTSLGCSFLENAFEKGGGKFHYELPVVEAGTENQAMTCDCNAAWRLDSRLERIEREIAKLREAVVQGIYDPRSLVGDAVLVVEGQLRQIRKDFSD